MLRGEAVSPVGSRVGWQQCWFTLEAEYTGHNVKGNNCGAKEAGRQRSPVIKNVGERALQ